MGAFDTAISPIASTPSNTSETTLLTVGSDTTANKDVQVTVDICVVTSDTPTVRLGIIPSGGSVQWKLYDDPVTSTNPISGMGPYFLQDGDVIRVQTSVASAVDFSATGTRSS